MIRTVLRTLSGLLVPLLFSTGAIAAVALRLSHFAADGTPNAIAALQFKTNVEKRTHGEVKIEVFGNNALGSPPEVLEQVLRGTIDMSLSGQDQLAKPLPLYDMISTPFAFSDYSVADKVIDGEFRTWVDPELDRIGLVHLGDWEWGFRQLTNSKRPVQFPADMKGMKIRTPPAFAFQSFVESAGANVVTIPFPELVAATKRGEIDGQENPVGTIAALKLYETQKYMTILNYTYSSLVHVVNKNSWAKLTATQQQILREESFKSAQLSRKLLREDEVHQLKVLEKRGMTIARPDLGPWKTAMGPAWERMKNRVGPDNFRKFMGIVDKYSR